MIVSGEKPLKDELDAPGWISKTATSDGEYRMSRLMPWI